MKQTKIGDVEMTGPAVVGLLFAVGGLLVLGPIGAAVGIVIGVVPLAWYRIARRP